MNTQMLYFIISFIATVVVGIIVLPILKKLKVSQTVRTDGPKTHLVKNGTPIMGGLMMLIVISIVLIVNLFTDKVMVLPLVAVLGFGIIGFIDDFIKMVLRSSDGLSPKKKMLGLFIVVALFIVLYLNVFHLGTDIIIPFVDQPVSMSVPVFIIFTAFILLGTSNAINLTDGLDGLASGVVAIIMTFFTIAAIRLQDTQMVIFGATCVGTCLGFLVFNFHPAKVFMGDTGSLALGGAVAAIAIILKMPLYLAVVALIPIIDTLSVILQVTYFKITKGKRIFKMAPFHHHLELSGMKETNVVILFWAITFVCCVIAYFI